MADSAPDLYSNAFIADRPKATQHLLQNRLQKAGIVANSLAAYFKERSAAELEYTKRLQKLAAKPLVTNPNSNLAFNAEGDDGLDKVLSNLEIELAEVIRIHEQAAKRFETQLSDTLRDAKVDTVGDGPINAAASDVSGSIRDYEEVSNRLSKSANSKGGSSLLGKKSNAPVDTAESTEELATAHAIWSTAAPAYLSAFQKAESQRWQIIKENIAKYATITSDLGRERMELAERALVNVVSWEPADDMQTFCLKEGGKTAPGALASTAVSARSGTSASRSGRGPAPAVPTRRGTSNPVQPAIVEPSPSIRSGMSSSQMADDGASKKEKKGFLSAFSKKVKRPGANRNRSSSKPDQYSNIGANDNGPLNGRDSPDTEQNRPSVDDPRHENSLRPDAPANANKSSKRDSFMPSIMRRKNSTANSMSSVGRESPQQQQQPLTQIEEPPTPLSDTFSNSQPRSPLDDTTPMEEISMPSLQPTRPAAVTNMPSESGSFASRNPFGALTPPIVSPTNDNDGSSNQAAPTYESSPQRGAEAVARSSDDAPQRLNMDIQQSNLIQENPDEREAALLKVQNTLLASNKNAPNVNRRSTARGRRSTFNPVPDDMPLSQISSPNVATNGRQDSPSSVFASPIGLPISMPSQPGRTGSILSSVSSQDNLVRSSSPFENPDGSGLRAAISETINVLSKADQPAKVMIVGEILLQLRDSPSPGHVSLKLSQDTSQLDKLAPNGQFLEALSKDEYAINTSALSASSGPTTVLKYHVIIDDPSQYVPLTIVPMWKCEAQQTSVLVTCTPNTSCRMAAASAGSPFDTDSSRQSATLKEVSFAIPVHSAGVSDIQSKPTAEYDADRKRLTWVVSDISLTDASPTKVLARFKVASQTQSGPVSAKWRMPGRLASGLSLEIGSTSGEITHFAEVTCQTVSGKYLVA